MRIFVPFKLADLSGIDISSRLVHGVTSNLCKAVPDEDAEGLEYVATLAAADDSLRMMSLEDTCSFRRIVAVAEVANSLLTLPEADDEVLESAIYLAEPIPITKFESFLVDEPGKEILVQSAVAGDENAFIATEDIELLWYDAIERKALYQELTN
ncbi:hypothetical protein RQN30_04865 [Arcanobacterium hippocoleae]